MLIASHSEHWDVMHRPLRGADPAELLARAGLPPSLAPLWADGIAQQPAFVERVWRHGVRWQVADFDAPAGLVRWLREPPARVEGRLPLLGLLGHAAAVRRVIGSRERQALRTAVGADAVAAVFDLPAAPQLHPFGRRWSSAAVLAGATTYLEHEGCRLLAGIGAACGEAWREVLRLRLPRRLEPPIVEAEALPIEQARAMVEALFERVEALQRQAAAGAAP